MVLLMKMIIEMSVVLWFMPSLNHYGAEDLRRVLKYYRQHLYCASSLDQPGFPNDKFSMFNFVTLWWWIPKLLGADGRSFSLIVRIPKLSLQLPHLTPLSSRTQCAYVCKFLTYG